MVETNETMITVTVRIPRKLDVALRRTGVLLGTHHTTLVRQCLLAIMVPSEPGDLMLETMRSASAYGEPTRTTDTRDEEPTIIN